MKLSLASTVDAVVDGLLAALVFWAPNVLIHWIRGYQFSLFDAVGLSVLLPAMTILFFRMVWWPFRRQARKLSQSMFAILGIWIAGPAMLTVSESFCGGGLSQPGAWHFFTLGTLLFPLFTLILSTYDGTLFAVLFATVLLPVLANSNAEVTPTR